MSSPREVQAMPTLDNTAEPSNAVPSSAAASGQDCLNAAATATAEALWRLEEQIAQSGLGAVPSQPMHQAPPAGAAATTSGRAGGEQLTTSNQPQRRDGSTASSASNVSSPAAGGAQLTAGSAEAGHHATASGHAQPGPAAPSQFSQIQFTSLPAEMTPPPTGSGMQAPEPAQQPTQQQPHPFAQPSAQPLSLFQSSFQHPASAAPSYPGPQPHHYPHHPHYPHHAHAHPAQAHQSCSNTPSTAAAAPPPPAAIPQPAPPSMYDLEMPHVSFLTSHDLMDLDDLFTQPAGHPAPGGAPLTVHDSLERTHFSERSTGGAVAGGVQAPQPPSHQAPQPQAQQAPLPQPQQVHHFAFAPSAASGPHGPMGHSHYHDGSSAMYAPFTPQQPQYAAPYGHPGHHGGHHATHHATHHHSHGAHMYGAPAAASPQVCPYSGAPISTAWHHSYGVDMQYNPNGHHHHNFHGHSMSAATSRFADHAAHTPHQAQHAHAALPSPWASAHYPHAHHAHLTGAQTPPIAFEPHGLRGLRPTASENAISRMVPMHAVPGAPAPDVARRHTYDIRAGSGAAWLTACDAAAAAGSPNASNRSDASGLLDVASGLLDAANGLLDAASGGAGDATPGHLTQAIVAAMTAGLRNSGGGGTDGGEAEVGSRGGAGRRRRRVHSAASGPGSAATAATAAAATAGDAPLLTVRTKSSGTSKFRGVTRHRWTQKWEAHLWDSSVARKKTAPGGRSRGKQIYLGGYASELEAARAYDRAAIVYWGEEATTNFPMAEYSEEMEELSGLTRDTVVAMLRRGSSGFSRGASKYRGVTRHHQAGKWEARIGRVGGSRYLYLGTFDSEDAAAMAYDYAAMRHRGSRAITNFNPRTYQDPTTLALLPLDRMPPQVTDNFVAASLAELDRAAALREGSDEEAEGTEAARAGSGSGSESGRKRRAPAAAAPQPAAVPGSVALSSQRSTVSDLAGGLLEAVRLMPAAAAAPAEAPAAPSPPPSGLGPIMLSLSALVTSLQPGGANPASLSPACSAGVPPAPAPAPMLAAAPPALVSAPVEAAPAAEASSLLMAAIRRTEADVSSAAASAAGAATAIGGPALTSEAAAWNWSLSAAAPAPAFEQAAPLAMSVDDEPRKQARTMHCDSPRAFPEHMVQP